MGQLRKGPQLRINCCHGIIPPEYYDILPGCLVPRTPGYEDVESMMAHCRPGLLTPVDATRPDGGRFVGCPGPGREMPSCRSAAVAVLSGAQQPYPC
jgi:hypothetical protein